MIEKVKYKQLSHLLKLRVNLTSNTQPLPYSAMRCLSELLKNSQDFRAYHLSSSSEGRPYGRTTILIALFELQALTLPLQQKWCWASYSKVETSTPSQAETPNLCCSSRFPGRTGSQKPQLQASSRQRSNQTHTISSAVSWSLPPGLTPTPLLSHPPYPNPISTTAEQRGTKWEFPSFLASSPRSISRKLKQGGVREERNHLTDTSMPELTENSFQRKWSIPKAIPSFHPLCPTQMTSGRSSLSRPSNVKIKKILQNRKQKPQSLQEGNHLGWRQHRGKMTSRRQDFLICNIMGALQEMCPPKLLLILAHRKKSQAGPSFLSTMLDGCPRHTIIRQNLVPQGLQVVSSPSHSIVLMTFSGPGCPGITWTQRR